MALLRRLTSSSLKAMSATMNVQISSKRNYADQMAFTLASAAQVYYHDQHIRQVDVPSYSGSFGILPNHVPVLAVIKPGVVTVYEEDGGTKKYFVSSGTISVNDDSSVQVLAEEAFPLEQLDAQAIREGLSKAQQDLTSASEANKASAQINVEVHEALAKAVE